MTNGCWGRLRLRVAEIQHMQSVGFTRVLRELNTIFYFKLMSNMNINFFRNIWTISFFFLSEWHMDYGQLVESNVCYSKKESLGQQKRRIDERGEIDRV
jgi:hypothetical protein